MQKYNNIKKPDMLEYRALDYPNAIDNLNSQLNTIVS